MFISIIEGVKRRDLVQRMHTPASSGHSPENKFPLMLSLLIISHVVCESMCQYRSFALIMSATVKEHKPEAEL